MAILHVGTNFTFEQGNAISTTVPTGVADDDLLVAVVVSSQSDEVPTGPTNGSWTVLTARLVDANLSVSTFWRWAVAADSGSTVGVNVKPSGLSLAKGGVSVSGYRGVDKTNPIVAAQALAEAGNSFSHVTPTVSGEGWLLSLWTDRGSGEAGWTDPPSGFTRRAEPLTTGGGRVTMLLGDSNGVVGPGTVGGLTAVSLVSQHQAIMASVILTEGAGTVSPPKSNEHLWIGGWSSDGFAIASRNVGVESPTVELWTGGVAVDSATPDADGYVRLIASGLAAATAHTWEIRDDVDVLASGITTTAPEVPANSLTAFGACFNGSGSDGAVFGNIISAAPDQFIHLGDFHYNNPSSSDPDVHLSLLNSKTNATPDLKALLATVPTTYIRSDHDGGGSDNSDPGPYYIASQTAYKRFVGHHNLVNQPTDALYSAWTVGRVRFIQLDTRNMYRSDATTADGPSKTMLGATQLAWLLNELDGPAPLKVVLSDPPWTSEVSGPADPFPLADKWANYATERQQIADHITGNGINVLMLVGDFHAVVFADGANNPYGGFPVVGVLPFWQTGSAGGGNATYDFELSAGTTPASRYGLLAVTDTGDSTITATVTAYDASDDSIIHTNSWDFSTISLPDVWDGVALRPGTEAAVWDGTVLRPVTSIDVWDGAALRPIT